jgi:hypothetical protein
MSLLKRVLGINMNWVGIYCIGWRFFVFNRECDCACYGGIALISGIYCCV